MSREVPSRTEIFSGGTVGDLYGHLAKLWQDKTRGQGRVGLFVIITVANTLTRGREYRRVCASGVWWEGSETSLRGSHSYDATSRACNLEFLPTPESPFPLSSLSPFNLGGSNPVGIPDIRVKLGGSGFLQLSFPRKLGAKSASAGRDGCSLKSFQLGISRTEKAIIHNLYLLMSLLC